MFFVFDGKFRGYTDYINDYIELLKNLQIHQNTNRRLNSKFFNEKDTNKRVIVNWTTYDALSEEKKNVAKVVTPDNWV